MSEFGGLWKQQNNSACTKLARVFKMLKLDTIQKKKKKEEGQPVLGQGLYLTITTSASEKEGK